MITRLLMTTGTSLPYLACMSNFTTRGASKHRRQPMFRVIVAVLLLATTTVAFGLFDPGTAHAAVATISGPARVYTSSDVGANHVPGAPFDPHFTGTDPIDSTHQHMTISGMTQNGNVTVSIPANATTAVALPHLGNAASTSLDNSITFQIAAPPSTPTVTINQASGQADSTSTSPIAFDVVFSAPVTGIGDACR